MKNLDIVISFFRQSINQWLGIALIGLICFWTVLYFFTHKADAIGDNHFSEVNSYLNN